MGQTIDMRTHGTNNKHQAMCSTHRDIWWPAWAHQQDRDRWGGAYRLASLKTNNINSIPRATFLYEREI